jgi:hypothetical protein
MKPVLWSDNIYIRIPMAILALASVHVVRILVPIDNELRILIIKKVSECACRSRIDRTTQVIVFSRTIDRTPAMIIQGVPIRPMSYDV